MGIQKFVSLNRRTITLCHFREATCVCVCMCCGEMVTCYNALCKHTVHHELLPYSSDWVVTTPVP